MVRIKAFSCSIDPCVSMNELKSLGCTFCIFDNICEERMDIDVYVNDDCYLQVLDFMLSISTSVIAKIVQETFDEDEMNYLVTLKKLKKHYAGSHS